MTYKKKKKIAKQSKQSCIFCGSKDNLTLHHLDPCEKIATVDLLTNVSSIQKEIKKCICLCDTCHQTYMHPSYQVFYDTHKEFKGLKAQKKFNDPAKRLLKMAGDIRLTLENRQFCEECGKKVRKSHLVPTNNLDIMIEQMLSDCISFHTIQNAYTAVKTLCTCCARDYVLENRTINSDDAKIPTAEILGITNEDKPIEVLQKISENGCVASIITMSNKKVYFTKKVAVLSSVKRQLKMSGFEHVSIIYKTMKTIHGFEVNSNAFIIWCNKERASELKNFCRDFCSGFSIDNFLFVDENGYGNFCDFQTSSIDIGKIEAEQISFYISQITQTWIEVLHVRIPFEEKNEKILKNIRNLFLGKTKDMKTL